MSRTFPDCRAALDRDFVTIQRRYESEGFGFLSKTLPRLGKNFLVSLENGSFTPDTGFKHRPGATFPLFLGVLYAKVFDIDSGAVLEDVDPLVVKDLLQIFFLLYKYEGEGMSPAHIEKARKKYVALDRKCMDNLSHRSAESIGSMYYAQIVLKQLIPEDDSFLDNLLPKHGPGAVSRGEKAWEKWRPKRFYKSLHQAFPYYTMWYYNGNHLVRRRREYLFLNRLYTAVSRQIMVPKDSRGPRVISAEELEYQYAQQALARALVPLLTERSYGRIQFLDQKLNNQRLALESSRSRENATLDLADASELVALWHILELLEERPRLLKMLTASRAPAVKLIDGTIHKLWKFAGMGSATCFPVEATLFYCVAVGALLAANLPLKVAMKSVYVYGDDIICPVEYMDDVVSALEAVGLQVNRGKSFSRGYFRESCGMDAYKGVQVTPLRIKKSCDIAAEQKDKRPTRVTLKASNLDSWRAYSDNSYRAGYWVLADFIRQHIKNEGVVLPVGVSPSSPILGHVCFQQNTELHDTGIARIFSARVIQPGSCTKATKANECDFQAPMVKGFTVYTPSQKHNLDGYSLLLKRGKSPPREMVADAFTERRTSRLRAARVPLSQVLGAGINTPDISQTWIQTCRFCCEGQPLQRYSVWPRLPHARITAPKFWRRQ